MITYLLPTRDRPGHLHSTLAAIGALAPEAHDAVGGAEVVVVDNASDPPARAPGALANGMPVRLLRLETNRGAAGRNAGAAEARGDWLVMLDDDSYPLDAGHVAVLASAPPGVAAIGAEIQLLDGTREAGGLPEVFVGCGAALRRQAFLDAGGYDASFGFYAEEYDLCARLLLAGHRVVHDLRFRVRHGKVAGGRDFNAILCNLVRNNGWVVERYAPRHRREEQLCEVIARYGEIAVKEGAAWGYAKGMTEMRAAQHGQPAQPMSDALFDRFLGLSHVRATIAASPLLARGARVAVVDEGKGAATVKRALREANVRVVAEDAAPEAVLVGTLSLGPMLDALDRRKRGGPPVVLPWRPEGGPGTTKRPEGERERAVPPRFAEPSRGRVQLAR